METNIRRRVPLVLLGVTDPAALEPLVGLLRREGMRLTVAVGDRACLRAAAAIEPDVILLDPRLPRPLVSLLRAHPLSKRARISWSQALGGSHPAQMADGSLSTAR